MDEKLKQEGLHIVVVGHVDHGKSTVIGRLLYDTDSLPQGAVDKVKRIARETGKPFEYAYLLDAFEEEQKQGITIDTTQIQFVTKKREYVIIDAPGHKEFLKNMISGAANANAALLLVDAKQGVQEQSKRHGYMLSLLGIEKVCGRQQDGSGGLLRGSVPQGCRRHEGVPGTAGGKASALFAGIGVSG